MKKQILISIFLFGSLTMNAQWSTTSPVYTTSLVGIGTNNPNSPFNVIVSTVPNIEIATFGTSYNANHPYWDKAVTIGLKDFHGYISLKNYDLGEKILLNANGDSYFNNGNIGIGTTSPRALVDIANTTPNNLKSVLARLPEGDNIGEGTYLGVKAYNTQPASISSFAIEHKFYGQINSSINFYRGSNSDNGFLTFNTNNNAERMRIDQNGNIGIGTTSPRALVDIANTTPNNLKSVLARLPEGDNIGEGTYLGVKAYNTQPASINSFAIEHKYYGQINSSINFYRGSSSDNGFLTFNTNNNTERMRIDQNGNVLIGTTNSDSRFKLNVEGTIRASEVKVCLKGGCDFVFKNDYNLMDLKELESFVKTNQHLPEIASEKEMVENGVNMKELQMKLLQKVEEMTLYLIVQNKKIEEQNRRTALIEEQNSLLKKEIELLKKK